MFLYRLSVRMLPAITEGLHITSTMFVFIVEKADQKSNTDHQNTFSLHFCFFKNYVSVSPCGLQMF